MSLSHLDRLCVLYRSAIAPKEIKTGWWRVEKSAVVIKVGEGRDKGKMVRDEVDERWRHKPRAVAGWHLEARRVVGSVLQSFREGLVSLARRTEVLCTRLILTCSSLPRKCRYSVLRRVLHDQNDPCHQVAVNAK